MDRADDPAIWPRGYWHTWETLAGSTYATALTKLRAWSNTATILLFVVAFVLLVYFLIAARTGSMLPAVLTLLAPWGIAVGVIEYKRGQIAKTIVRNLAASGKPVSVVPPLAEAQFQRWKHDHNVTTDDLQNSAPLTP